MVSIGLIGLGQWGRNHFKTLKDMEGIVIPIVSDSLVNEGLRGGVNFVKDYCEIVDCKDIDGVVVATPAATHYAIAKDLLNSGKHVLIEKPITTNLAEGKELCELAERNNRVLMVGEIFRFNPAVTYILDQIDKGTIGDVKYVEARRVGLGPVRNDVSVLWDLASHDAYLAHMFTRSKTKSVGYHGASFNEVVDDVVSLALRLPECFGSVYVNWAHPIKERRFTVGGSKGAFVFDDIHPTDKVLHYERGVDYQPTTGGIGPFLASVRGGDIHIPSVDLRRSPLEKELAYFADCIKKNRLDGISSGRVGLESLAVLEAAERSRKENGREVPVIYV